MRLWLALLTVTFLTLLSLSLTTIQTPGNHITLVKKQIRDWKQHVFKSTAVTSQSIADCRPYELRGVLNLDQTNWTENAWIPFDHTCQAKDWMRQLNHVLHPEYDQSDNTSFAKADISWMQNRTIVLFGDSIDRHQVEDFCYQLGLPWELITMDHPATPQIPQHFWDEDQAEEGHDYANTAGHGRPTVCHVPQLNLTMVDIYHWGMGTVEELKTAGFLNNFHYQPPALTMDRFHHVVLPLLKNLGRDIDIMQFSAYAWDTHLWRFVDAVRHGGAYPEQVNVPDANTYSVRLRAALLEIAQHIPPSAQFLWRHPHYILTHAGTVNSRMGIALKNQAATVLEDLTGRKWDLVANAREAELLALHRDRSAPLPDLRSVGLGPLVLGYEHQFLDPIHFGFTQDYVGANILLEELRRHVSRNEL